MSERLFIELFSGTARMAEAFKRRGWNTLTLDNDPSTNPDIVGDILDPKIQDKIIELANSKEVILWASPPCTAFSVASIGKNWQKTGFGIFPKSKSAEQGIEILKTTMRMIHRIKPKTWFVENPRGMMRRLMNVHSRSTVTYCQYGETRMKPTDIWHNSPLWKPRLACKNGDACHEAAPRGARTGTQGIKGAKMRGALPYELCDEIAEACTFNK